MAEKIAYIGDIAVKNCVKFAIVQTFDDKKQEFLWECTDEIPENIPFERVYLTDGTKLKNYEHARGYDFTGDYTIDMVTDIINNSLHAGYFPENQSSGELNMFPVRFTQNISQ